MSSVPEGRFRRSLVPLITRGARRTVLRAADGVRTEALYEPSPGGGTDGPAIAVAHGFTGSRTGPRCGALPGCSGSTQP